MLCTELPPPSPFFPLYIFQREGWFRVSLGASHGRQSSSVSAKMNSDRDGERESGSGQVYMTGVPSWSPGGRKKRRKKQ